MRTEGAPNGTEDEPKGTACAPNAHRRRTEGAPIPWPTVWPKSVANCPPTPWQKSAPQMLHNLLCAIARLLRQKLNTWLEITLLPKTEPTHTTYQQGHPGHDGNRDGEQIL